MEKTSNTSNPTWVVVEFRVKQEKSKETEVFYTAVPSSWIDFGEKTILNWSGHFTSGSIIRRGAPPKAPIKKYVCKIISKVFDNYIDANEEEIRIFEEKKSKTDLTTEVDSDEAEINFNKSRDTAVKDTTKHDFNELAKNLIKTR